MAQEDSLSTCSIETLVSRLYDTAHSPRLWLDTLDELTASLARPRPSASPADTHPNAVLDTLRHAVVSCDPRGRLLSANASARAALSSAGPVFLSPSGFLAVPAPAQENLRLALQRTAAGHSVTCSVPTTWPEPPLILNLAPVPQHPPVHRIIVAWDTQPLPPLTAPRLETLAAALALTAAETRVALLVAEGFDTSDVAIHLDIQPNTVRIHLKRIYAKTSTNSRAALAHLVLRVCHSLHLLQ